MIDALMRAAVVAIFVFSLLESIEWWFQVDSSIPLRTKVSLSLSTGALLMALGVLS